MRAAETLHPDVPDHRRLELVAIKLIPHTAKTPAAICGDPIKDDAELNAIRQNQAEWEREHALAVKFNISGAKSRYVQMVTSKINSGTEPEEHFHSMEAYVADQMIHHKVHMKRVERISAEARKLAEPIIERALKVAVEWLLERESSDRELADAFGVPYEPSNILSAGIHFLLTETHKTWRPKNVQSHESIKSMLAGLVSL